MDIREWCKYRLYVKGCKYWLHVNGEIIGYKWVYAIWMLIEVLALNYMLTSDDIMEWVVNDHDWWWMDEIDIECCTLSLTVIE